ncbi:HIT family hydrolase, diadenosine tetraphosphate hydrolase [Desulfitobacterium dichloroeliminans LMG P-21439]|uniref:HIT family hydrolase, diadenosine tetraphosphate hydrolase n=1 Tax=Desulfitobacterium dichloroeliminans (strain LMG P-21439 / DCA1) TaxID=871963 RepID=L0FB11_DESDL|nr:histidine triad nucleotide-binding protein [Desulfitobacterium dichloroeliminans]AGA70412.1 HIT family hydrolase, diadenosine tetraphosphate hydrolase [Desulfitobacterium dichloroeliminans LMG P-21439]
MSDCIFCKIINKEIPSEVVYEDEVVLAFKDINPVAPVHVLIIPKKHSESLNDLSPEDEALVGHLIIVATRLAKELGIADSGYRLVNNCGDDGGQVVKHLHFHLIGGKRLGIHIC